MTKPTDIEIGDPICCMELFVSHGSWLDMEGFPPEPCDTKIGREYDEIRLTKYQ